MDVCLLYSLFKTGLSIRSSRFIPRAREGRWAGREDTTRLIFLSLIKSRIARPATWPLPPAVRERGRNRKKTEWAQVWVAPHCPPLRAPVGHANAESQPCDAAGGCYKVQGTRTPRPSLAGDSKTVRHTPAPALTAGPFVPSDGAICGRPRGGSLAARSTLIGTRRPACTDSAKGVP